MPRCPSLLRLTEACSDREVYQLGNGPDIQLRHQVGAMTFDRTLVDIHVVSDRLIPSPFQDVEQDLALPRRQSLAALLKLEAAVPQAHGGGLRLGA